MTHRAFWPVIFAGTAAIICILAITGCYSGPKIPASGNLQIYPVSTTVDDESARYYLENYLAGKPANPQLQWRIENIHAQLQDAVPNRDQLKDFSREFSVDFAALLFANQLLKQKGNPELQSQFLKNLEAVRAGTVAYPKKDTLIMLVPGYDYAANGPKTGADFARPRKMFEQAGYEVRFVAIDPLGSVEENAAYLAKEIVAHRDRKIALAGASSAAPPFIWPWANSSSRRTSAT